MDDRELDDFWEDSAYARKSYVEKPLTDATLRAAESELGVKLPAAYVALMRHQNGGIPKRTCFPSEEPTSWAEDHVAITGIMGIGREKPYSLLGQLGSRFMQREWGYPEFGICICDCPSAGHDMIMLDYRACGPDGEPSVIHVDQERDFAVTPLAPDFETFIRGLVHESDFQEDPKEVLARERDRVEHGRFSSPMQALIAATPDPGALERSLRALLIAIVEGKGHFSLHGDPESELVYDVLFDLVASSRRVAAGQAFLDAYPGLIVSGDGEACTRGYAPGFVADWLRKRTDAGAIVQGGDGLALSAAHRAEVLRSLARYG